MPNYCENKIGFICDEANTGELEKLYSILYNIFTTPYQCKYGFGDTWLGRVALAHELDYEKIPCKGYICDIGDLDEDSTHFKISTETHWRVTVDLWDAVIKQYTGIRYVYVSDETSGGVYINTDSESVCFPEKYGIYAYMSDSSYDELPPDYFTGTITPMELFDERNTFKDFKELQEFMAEITGKTFETVNCMNSYFQNAMKTYDRDNDGLDKSVVEIYEYMAQPQETEYGFDISQNHNVCIKFKNIITERNDRFAMHI